MTVLILTHSYPGATNWWRGVFVMEQAKALDTIHDVIVVFFKVDYSHFAPFSKYSFVRKQEGRITVYEVTTGRSFPVINQLKYLLDTYSFIKKEIPDNKKIDVIHSHLSYPAGFLGTLISKRKRIPHVLTEHSSIKKYYRSFIHKICVRYALKNSQSIICVSRALREEIVKVVNRDVNVIPNVIDFDRFRIQRRKSDNLFNIGFLGNLDTYNKGLDLLLKSASILKNHNYILHIGGKGALFDSYIKMAEESGIKERCRFYGGILPGNIVDFYTKLDFFVLPSRYETFGIVLVEAMACGLPVIATKCGGPEDIVIPLTGLLISKDSIQELTDAISDMSVNLEKYDREAIRNYVNEKFGRKALLDNIATVYNKILSIPQVH